MRLTTLILGLMFCAWIMLEGFLASIAFDVGNAADESSMAALGMMAGFIGLIAAAFVMAFPLFSTFGFILAGLFSLGAAANGYPNHKVYVVMIFGFALLSFFGWRGKRKERREQQVEQQRQIDRDNRMERLLEQQQARGAATGNGWPNDPAPLSCPACGHHNAPGTKFCAECGSPMRVVSTA